MQRVAEFVERGGHFIPGQQRRLAGAGLGNIEVLADHRLRTHQARLAHILVHPRATTLVAACIPVDVNQRQRLAVLVEHFEHAHGRIVDRQFLAFLEGQAVQLVGRVEHAVLQHIVHFQIGLELRLVEVVTRRAHFLGVVGPVPGFQLEAALLGIDDRLHVGGFDLGVGNGGRGQVREQLVHGGRRLCGLVFKHVGGMVRVAEQYGAFGAQLRDLQDGFAVVELATVGAAHNGGIVETLAKRAILQHGLRWLAGGIHQRQHVLAFHLARLGGLGGCGDGCFRHAVEFGTRVDDNGRRVGFLQNVLGEGGGQGGQVGVDGLQLHLVGIRQLRAGANEVSVVTLEQAHRFGVQAQGGARSMQRLHAGKKFPVQHDRVVVGGQLRRHLTLDGVERVIGVGTGHAEEGGRNPAQHLAAALHRDDGVFKAGRIGLVGDGVDLDQLLAHAFVEGRRVMLVVDLVEGHRMQVKRAWRIERVGLDAGRDRGSGCGCGSGFSRRVGLGDGLAAGGSGQREAGGNGDSEGFGGHRVSRFRSEGRGFIGARAQGADTGRRDASRNACLGHVPKAPVGLGKCPLALIMDQWTVNRSRRDSSSPACSK